MSLLFRMNQPDVLVDELVNALPEHLFASSTATFCDPAMGKGDYLVGVAKRLIKYGHTRDNVLSRLYGYEMSQLYINTSENMTPLRGAHLEVMTYDKVVAGGIKMKFDCVVGNPPYESPSNKGHKVFRDFITIAIKQLITPDGIIALVTPNQWLSREDKTLKVVLQDHHIMFADVRSRHIKTEYFPTIDTTFCWYVIGKRTQQYHTTQLHTIDGVIDYDMDRYGFIPVQGQGSNAPDLTPNALLLSILDKYLGYDGPCVDGGFVTTRGHGTRVKYQNDQDDIFHVPMYHTQLEDKCVKYVEHSVPHHDQSKVFISMEYLSNPDAIRTLYRSDPFSNMNNIAYWITNDTDAEQIVAFCNSEFFRLMLMCQTTKRCIPVPIIKATRVPLDVTDIRDTYKFTDREWAYISSLSTK